MTNVNLYKSFHQMSCFKSWRSIHEFIVPTPDFRFEIGSTNENSRKAKSKGNNHHEIGLFFCSAAG